MVMPALPSKLVLCYSAWHSLPKDSSYKTTDLILLLITSRLDRNSQPNQLHHLTQTLLDLLACTSLMPFYTKARALLLTFTGPPLYTLINTWSCISYLPLNSALSQAEKTCLRLHRALQHKAQLSLSWGFQRYRLAGVPIPAHHKQLR